MTLRGFTVCINFGFWRVTYAPWPEAQFLAKYTVVDRARVFCPSLTYNILEMEARGWASQVSSCKTGNWAYGQVQWWGCNAAEGWPGLKEVQQSWRQMSFVTFMGAGVTQDRGQWRKGLSPGQLRATSQEGCAGPERRGVWKQGSVLGLFCFVLFFTSLCQIPYAW